MTAATLLLIWNVPEIIYYTYVTLDFITLTQYLLYNNKILSYMEHILYKFDKIKLHLKIIVQLMQNYSNQYLIIKNSIL